MNRKIVLSLLAVLSLPAASFAAPMHRSEPVRDRVEEPCAKPVMKKVSHRRFEREQARRRMEEKRREEQLRRERAMKLRNWQSRQARR